MNPLAGMTDQQIADQLTAVNAALTAQGAQSTALSKEQVAIQEARTLELAVFVKANTAVVSATADLIAAKRNNAPGSPAVLAAEATLKAAQDRVDASQGRLDALDQKNGQVQVKINANADSGTRLRFELDALLREQQRRVDAGKIGLTGAGVDASTVAA